MIKQMNSFSWERFKQLPLIGILRGFSLKQTLELMPILVEEEWANLEITMNSEEVAHQIKDLSLSYGSQMNIGAGTVTSMKQLEQALSAGASFIVTPVVVEDVIKACKKQKIPIFPGLLILEEPDTLKISEHLCLTSLFYRQVESKLNISMIISRQELRDLESEGRFSIKNELRLKIGHGYVCKSKVLKML